MIFDIIEPATGTAGLGVIRLTEMKRIFFHKFLMKRGGNPLCLSF